MRSLTHPYTHTQKNINLTCLVIKYNLISIIRFFFFRNVNIQIKDGGFTANYLSAPILKALNKIFTEKMWTYTMNTLLKNETEKYLDIISKSLFKAQLNLKYVKHVFKCYIKYKRNINPEVNYV